MVMLLQRILIMLNLLFVTSHEEFIQSKLKTLNKFENIKDTIAKRAIEEILCQAKNYFKNCRVSTIRYDENDADGKVLLINACKRNIKVKKVNQNVETVDKNKYDRNMHFDTESGRPLERVRTYSIKNFLNNLKGHFTGNIHFSNSVKYPYPTYNQEWKNDYINTDQRKTTTTTRPSTTITRPTTTSAGPMATDMRPVFVHLRKVHCVLNCSFKTQPPQMICDPQPALGGSFDDCFYLKDTTEE